MVTVRLSAQGVNVNKEPEFEWQTWQSNKGRCSNEVLIDANEGDYVRTIRCTQPLAHSGDHEYTHHKSDGSYIQVRWREKTNAD